ncbi:reverse transcriptase domain, reverse transcriptase zinc-binding domain protein [Tanacetum coccineum]|uniref:Reverse transcriptase domain, reverse transcriptase zinc-binding domain protein n=1 Tax=Tanacetum coccineum TaxID=301880 RepID=A0ABQ5EQI0_9ASTR
MTPIMVAKQGETTDENRIAWIAWDKANSSISNGGLAIGTLKSINHAMFCKWGWRFHTENHAFWCKIIRSIHGVDGGLNDTFLIKSKSGPWYRIAKLKISTARLAFTNPSIFKKKIVDSCNTRFWLDTWLGGSPLKDTFPRLFWLDSNPACLVCNRCPTFQPLTHVPIRSSLELCELSEFCSLVAHLRLSDNSDSWECIIDDSRAFSVKMMRSYINQKFPTLQCSLPMCDDAIESEDHIFASCSIAKDTWKCIAWNIPSIIIANLIEGLNLADRVPLPAASIRFFNVVNAIAPGFISTDLSAHLGKKEKKIMLVETLLDDLCSTLILADNEIVSICKLDQMNELNTLDEESDGFWFKQYVYYFQRKILIEILQSIGAYDTYPVRIFSIMDYIQTLEKLSKAKFDSMLQQSTTWCIPKYQSRKEMAGNNGGKDGQITLHYPMLSRSNYAAWAIKMRVFMQAQGVWEAVEPRTANTVVEVKKDKMTLAAIYQGIPEDLLLSFSEKKSAKEA